MSARLVELRARRDWLDPGGSTPMAHALKDPHDAPDPLVLDSPRTPAMPIGKVLAKIRVAILIFVTGSAADAISTWRCWTVLKPHEGHEANFIVVYFVRHLGMATGLVACKVAAAVVVLASSVTLGRLFPGHVTDYRLAEALFVVMGCIY